MGGVLSKRAAWAFLAPTLLVLGVFGFLPFVYVIWVAFQDWNLFGNRGRVYTGADNFRQLVTDPAFLEALGRTLVFTAWTVFSTIVLGFLLAKLLTRDFPGKALFRGIHTLPLMIAPITVGATWRLMTAQGFGPLPYYLDKWFGWELNLGRDPTQAFFAAVAMDVWHWTPLVTLTLLAGLASLPREPFEAARVDGASALQTFRHITLPLLLPTLLTTVLLRVMDALRVVEDVFMLTGEGPAGSTRFVGIYLWRQVFAKQAYGYGSAMSVLLLYFTIVLCWLLYVISTGRRQKASA
jgi:multiple sugar transport system permease protein